MSTAALVRWSGLALLVGGMLLAAHILSHPEGQVAGAHLAMSGGWALSHALHFYASVCLLVGVVGLYLRQSAEAGRFGALAFVVALVGTGMWVGTGMVTAFLWPIIGAHAPAMTEADGPIFHPPMPIIGVTGGLFMLGWLLLGVATARARVLPRVGGVLLAAGAVLAMMPPRPISPVPWAVLSTGSVLFALGAIITGAAIWAPGRSAVLRASTA